MATTQYAKGRAFEYQTRDDLVSNGYETIRSAGSKGKVDIFAFKPGQMLFIQCKRDAKISPAERAEVFRLANLVKAIPLVAYKIPGKAKVLYMELTGVGPKDRVPFELDQIVDLEDTA